MWNKTTTMTDHNPIKEAAAFSLPTAKFVLVPVVMAALVDAAMAAAVAVAWPDRLLSVGLGAGGLLCGLAAGSLAIQPWKPRTKTVWPTMVLASQGISMGAVTAAAVSLYSATRPDALAFLAAVAMPFPAAMIAQARLVLGPALGVSAGDGHLAQDNH